MAEFVAMSPSSGWTVTRGHATEHCCEVCECERKETKTLVLLGFIVKT
jgi:hypothetical protein